MPAAERPALSVSGPHLLAGPRHFLVSEEPAYASEGAGEHLYIEIEKEGLTTDQVAEALAKACGRGTRDVGYAGRKDRHAITRQWFSVWFGEEAQLARLSEHLPKHGRAAVLAVSRHRNKLRLGHLAGNQFRLGLGGCDDAGRAALAERFTCLAREGLRHRFGPQRFGVNGATLRLARAWGGGDAEAAVAAAIDPADRWRFGEPPPSGFRYGPEGRVLAALRRGDGAARALSAAGESLRKLAASAAQAAVYNAVLDARERLGLLHRLRAGDLACTARGAPFTVTAADADDSTRRAGRLDCFATAPLPGDMRLRPSPEIDAEERAWSAETGIDWAWFLPRQPLASPGERRQLLAPFRSPPVIAAEGEITWVSFALPPGAYATEALAQVGVALPEDRRG